VCMCMCVLLALLELNVKVTDQSQSHGFVATVAGDRAAVVGGAWPVMPRTGKISSYFRNYNYIDYGWIKWILRCIAHN